MDQALHRRDAFAHLAQRMIFGFMGHVKASHEVVVGLGHLAVALPQADVLLRNALHCCHCRLRQLEHHPQKPKLLARQTRRLVDQILDQQLVQGIGIRDRDSFAIRRFLFGESIGEPDIVQPTFRVVVHQCAPDWGRG